MPLSNSSSFLLSSILLFRLNLILLLYSLSFFLLFLLVRTKLKLGYLSSDVGKEEDSIYRMMHELSSAHNEEKWEVHCFQTVPILPVTTSGTPQTLQTTSGEDRRCSRLHDLSSMSPGILFLFVPFSLSIESHLHSFSFIPST
jgi:hypothetical protein